MITLFFRKRTSGFNSIEQLFGWLIPYFRNVTVISLPKKNVSPINFLNNIFFARKHCSAVNHITGDINYVSIGLKKCNTILTLHDIESLLQGNRIKKFFIFIFWLWLPVRKVRFVTVISEATKSKLLSTIKVNPNKIRVIHNCVSPEFVFFPKAFSDYPVILHIGTKPNKNLERTIKAIKDIPCKLVILGKLTETQLKLLVNYSIHYESFFQVPFEQVVQLYEQCDLLSFVSLYEGFGLPIIETQAVGRPVITSNTSAMPEIAGDAALLVNPYQVEDIRNAILSVITNQELRDNLIEKGLKNIERFRAEIIAKKYMELYDEIGKD